ncbi:hypothetical protein HHI36_004823 [Cryptolaemus montrouzieri]|uniref:Reverse transcriptase domain-containing protein n=1 Tax=Cryptolaemus montrouzieri TaxID=559131 RepID=A0ABD2NSA8_9CUCU
MTYSAQVVFPLNLERLKLLPFSNLGKIQNFLVVIDLSVSFKILERLLYQRLQPIIDRALSTSQGGFRKNWNCSDQVLGLSTFIGTGFQCNLKISAVFVDLSSAYDTVWKDGLVYELFEVVQCGKIVKLIENMLSDRRLRVFIGEKSSRFNTLNDGLPQGFVLAPLLFNLYMSDIPETSSTKFIYADDIALVFRHYDFETIEHTLTSALDILNIFFEKWRLCPNPSKTEVSCFHLNNHEKEYSSINHY